MKHKLRNKLATLFLAAATATYLFVGCNNAPTEPAESVLDENAPLDTTTTVISTEDVTSDSTDVTTQSPKTEEKITSTTDILEPTTTAVTTELSEPTTEPAYEVEASFVDETATMYCTGSGVNIRESYSTSSNSLGKLAYQDSIAVTGIGFANGYKWYRISYNKTTAYVVSDYFSSSKPLDKPIASTASGKPSTSTSTSTGTATITMPDGSTAKAELKSDGNVWINGQNYGKSGKAMKIEDGVIYFLSVSGKWKVWIADGLANSGGVISVSEDEFVGDWGVHLGE